VYTAGRVYEPDLKLTERYRELFETFEKVYPGLKDVNAGIRAGV